MAKILIVTSRFPFPLEKGDKLRIYNQIIHLGKEHDIYLVALNHKAVNQEHLAQVMRHCKSVTVHVIPLYKRLLNLIKCIFSTKPFQVAYFFSSRVKQKISGDIRRVGPDVIYCHLIRTSEYVKDFTNISKTLDYMDCFSRGLELRLDKVKATNPIKYILPLERRRVLNYEAAIFDYFQHHIIISAQDRDHLAHPLRDSVQIVPNGVDFSVFHPIQFVKRYELLFTGNMGYPPNIDAAYFAATKVLPLLLEKYPGIVLLIAGVNPPTKIKRLAGKNIEVIAHFDHIRLAFAQAEINLVPTVTSIGLQNKILQGMAMKLPTVTNLAGARGISSEGQDVMLLGETAEEMAEQIELLLKNKDFGDALAEKAFTHVQTLFDWQIHNQRLQQILFS